MALTLAILPAVTPIFMATDTPLNGTIGYVQAGKRGTPRGLLLSLTIAPLYFKAIKTADGFKEIV